MRRPTHAPISFAGGHPEVSAEPSGILAVVVASRGFRKGTWGAEVVATLQPAKDDIVVEGKWGLDCFAMFSRPMTHRAFLDARAFA